MTISKHIDRYVGKHIDKNIENSFDLFINL